MSDFMLKVNISISTIQIFLIKNVSPLILVSSLIIIYGLYLLIERAEAASLF